jgi:hypothetical protein
MSKRNSKLPKSTRPGSRTITFRIPDDIRRKLSAFAIKLRMKETAVLCEALRRVMREKPLYRMPGDES